VTSAIRVLIVDDERPARDRLRHLLAAATDIEIVGDAEDGESAMQQIAQHAPDVVFLDIQMPGCTGLELVASLPAPRPRIVFCTAYDAHAVDAFELNAVDYLLKPVNRARLDKALERLRQPGGEVDGPIDRATRTEGAPARLLARRGSTFRVIQARDVLCFVSEHSLTKAIVDGDHYWMQPTLNELEERLDASQFFRISRAAIVNLDAVKEVAPLPGGHAEVRLTDGARLEVSRRRFKDLTARLGGA
jgi:two-component system LytT family response regulator